MPEKRYHGIPSGLLPVLIDLYFTYYYNGHLLIHRPSFTQALERETVRLDLVLSICALAAKFYVDERGSASLVEAQFCREWAEAAGRMALREYECPSRQNIIVFLNLALYWYTGGGFQRSSMHSGCAYNTAWTLGLPCVQQEIDEPMESEQRRRAFWGCYLLNSFSWASLFPRVPTDAMLNIKLPCPESKFKAGAPQCSITLRSGQGTQSIFAELVRAMATWSEVVALIGKPEADLSTRLVGIQAQEARLQEAFSKISGEFQLSCESMPSTAPDDLANLLLLHVIYHQCWCSLHSSIVPLFSWSDGDDNYSYAQQLSGQLALDHSYAVSALLETALGLDWDPRRMPSFIGYAAYCACAIQTPFLWCSNVSVKQHAVRSMLANLKTLQILGNHWVFLKVLGRYAYRLYKAHRNHPFPLTDEPAKMGPAAMKGFKATNPRARQSILTHNTIIVNEEGSFARGTEDIGDLGLEEDPATAGVRAAPGPGAGAGAVAGAGPEDEESLTSFISQISREERAAPVDGQLALMLDPLLPPDDLAAYEFGRFGGAFDLSGEGGDLESFGHVEDWISELLREEVP
ncbi:Fungal specific transcription factor domain-containing protein [Cladophialophora immunda]|nr:Fungal specific transcription factor domain-containing protein [Cladophialophora immunda]